MSSNPSDLYSQGFNFRSFLQKGVDPRTGQYTVSIQLFDAPSETRNCPSLKLSLSYNPLNTKDIGLGTGWSFNLPSYDHRQGKTLLLSTGENFQATETTSAFFIQDQKLKSFQAKRTGSSAGSTYEVAYKSGQVEILSGFNNTYNQSVPITIYGANGRALSLEWTRNGEQPRLSKIQDGDDVLLEVQYSDAQVTITKAPGTTAASTFTLIRRNAQLTQLELPLDDDTPPWQFSYNSLSNGFVCVSQVTGPTGLVEEVNYKQDGHQLPSGAPFTRIPYVVSHVARPGRQQPAIKTTYSYSSYNFLGYGGGRQWSATGDNLYQVPAEYQYTSTAQLEGGATTTYTYNKFHLTTKIEEQLNTKKSTQDITYHATPNTAFDHQPAQYLLPKTVAITYADTTASSRTETTTTEFDEWGNPTTEIKTDGLITTRTYYAADGEADCPADPHGFQRYLTEKFGYSELPTSSNATVQTFVLQSSRITLEGDTSLTTAEYTYINQPDSRDHGRVQEQKTWLSSKDNATTQTYAYEYLSSGELKKTLNTAGFDGVSAKFETVHSLSSGKVTGQTDDAGIQDVFQYDALGRLVKAATAIDTDQEAVRYNSYSIPDDGSSGMVLSVTDAKGVQTQYISDGLERICQVKRQDDNGLWDASTNTYSGTFRLLQERNYNALGQHVEQTDIDWLRTTDSDPTELRTTKELQYDEWGQVLKTVSKSTGVTTISATDPISLSQTEGIEGEGQSVTQLNLSGVPTQIRLLGKNGTEYSKLTYSYDGLGRLVEEEDALGRKTKYQSDSFDRVTKTTWVSGREVNVQYATQSAAALPTSLQVNDTNLGGQSFDGLDRLTQRTVGGRSLKQSYQGSTPEPTQIATDKGDFKLTYEPGLRQSLSTISSQDRNETYKYDSKTGVALRLKGSSSTADRQYYPSGLLKSEALDLSEGAASFSTQSTYSMAGKLQGYTDVHGKEYQNTYDSAGRLSSLAVGSLTVSYSYDSANRLSGTTVQDQEHDSSLTTNLVYDDFGREIERTVLQGENQVSRLTQSFGETSLITTRQVEDNGNIVRNESFAYDEHNRLVKYTCEGSELPKDEKGHEIQSQEFTFDNLDNITSVTTGFQDGTQNTATYSYSQSDPTQLSQITNSNPDFTPQTTLAYDANGCLIQDEQGRNLEYDSGGRLKSVRDSSGSLLSQYNYDAAGKLISQSIPDQPDTQLFYRQDKLISVKSGDRQVSYISAGNEYLGQSTQNGDPTEIQLWGSDANGSVLNWFNPAQPDQIHQQQYTPYGFSAPDSASSIGFNGQWRDPVTGWYHLGNGYRVYNPVLMRYHVPDPGSPFGTGEVNGYAYCLGDPINRIDPSGQWSFFGLFDFSWADLVSTVIGVVVSVAVGVLTAGASVAIEVGVGIAAGVATSAGVGIGTDLVEGRMPTWKSVGIDALSGLVGGVLGEAGGRFLASGLKFATNFKSFIGRAGSYTVNEVAKTGFETFKEAVKGAVEGEIAGQLSYGLYGDALSSALEGEDSSSSSQQVSSSSPVTRLPSSSQPSQKGQVVAVREASLARDPIRLSLRDGQSTVSSNRDRAFGKDAGKSIPGILNRQLKCTFGPLGASQGKRQATGSGALESLEKKRRSCASVRSQIRAQGV
ncbi:RHS repeat domain-containing protein [Aspergillus vadensis CBS 113365]|uniref:RHS repeat protein n=1 Tax=Aspergillus vadensis (strain CBS 113365 / IMI 142717 / IBT 24658) TaxID=1448311 RepID=A0A319BK36_ASPVC|nr:RHS repeat protein [Aspergillus vadensis CBS 113365]PYH73075.1 RHS repeat protein [Aspergillus vadensis CBS 113365]